MRELLRTYVLAAISAFAYLHLLAQVSKLSEAADFFLFFTAAALVSGIADFRQWESLTAKQDFWQSRNPASIALNLKFERTLLLPIAVLVIVSVCIGGDKYWGALFGLYLIAFHWNAASPGQVCRVWFPSEYEFMSHLTGAVARLTAIMLLMKGMNMFTAVMVLVVREAFLALWVSWRLKIKAPGNRFLSARQFVQHGRAHLSSVISSWIKLANTRVNALVCLVFLGETAFVDLRLCAEYAGTAVQAIRPVVVRRIPASLRDTAASGRIGIKVIGISMLLSLACIACGATSIGLVYWQTGKTLDSVFWAAQLGCLVGGFFALLGFANRSIIVARGMIALVNLITVLLSLAYFVMIALLLESGVMVYLMGLLVPVIISLLTPVLVCLYPSKSRGIQ